MPLAHARVRDRLPRRRRLGCPRAVAQLASERRREDVDAREEQAREHGADDDARDAEHRDPAERARAARRDPAFARRCRRDAGARGCRGCSRRARTKPSARARGRCRRGGTARRRRAPRSSAVPTDGSADATAITMPQNTGLSIPTTAKAIPPSAPCSVPMIRMLFSVARVTARPFLAISRLSSSNSGVYSLRNASSRGPRTKK